MTRRDQREEIAALLPAVRQSTRRAKAALDRRLARRKCFDAEAQRREAFARAKASAEFADFDFTALALRAAENYGR